MWLSYFQNFDNSESPTFPPFFTMISSEKHDNLCMTINNYWMRLSMISWIIKTEVLTRHEVLIIHDIMRKPNSIIVLLYIFHMIHPQKQKRSFRPFCFWGEHSKGLSNQADVELDMINGNICSRYCIYHVKFTSYCELIECSRPIRFFIASLMYKNCFYLINNWNIYPRQPFSTKYCYQRLLTKNQKLIIKYISKQKCTKLKTVQKTTIEIIIEITSNNRPRLS